MPTQSIYGMPSSVKLMRRSCEHQHEIKKKKRETWFIFCLAAASRRFHFKLNLSYEKMFQLIHLTAVFRICFFSIFLALEHPNTNVIMYSLRTTTTTNRWLIFQFKTKACRRFEIVISSICSNFKWHSKNERKKKLHLYHRETERLSILFSFSIFFSFVSRLLFSSIHNQTHGPVRIEMEKNREFLQYMLLS